MRKISILLLLFLSFMINGYSEDAFEKYQIVSLENLYNQIGLQDSSNLSFEEQMDRFSEIWQENWILEITKGIEVPLNLNLKGDFFHLDPEDNYVSIFVDKTFYMRLVDEDDVLLSTDLITWLDPEDFFTGKMDVKYLNHKDKSFINFLLEINQR